MNRTLVTLAALAFATGISSAANAAHYKAIHTFCGQADCTDGSGPWGPPVTDGHGNFYGSTNAGGAKSSGVVYRMHYDGLHWRYTRIHSFCGQKNCADGAHGQSGMVVDMDGNLYGVTGSGGNNSGWGTIFELSPNGGGWTYKVLHNFCSVHDCADGGQPVSAGLTYEGQASGLLYDGKSPLFGATVAGGTHNAGTLYKLVPNKAKTKWTKTVLHNFCTQASCADGNGPYTSPMVDGMGNLFGVTSAGGAFGHGAVYELSPNGGNWKHVVLHSFCSDAPTCTGGAQPMGTPVMDTQGNLYGTTFAGGAGAGGTAWKLVPNGVHSRLTTLHNFCNESACADGTEPWARLMIDSDGHLLGTTFQGGDMNRGTIFKLTGPKLTIFTRLFSFDSAAAPGATPVGGLMTDPDGIIYGSVPSGGANMSGVFYRLTP